MFLRLPAGMTATRMAANLSRTQAIVDKEMPDSDLPIRIEVVEYQQSLNRDARRPLMLLYAVVFGIWALACLNVTSLILTCAIGEQS